MKYVNNRKYERSTKFTVEGFNMPPTEFFPAFNWTWGSPVTKEGIEERIDRMYEKNIKLFYILPIPGDFRPTTNPTDMRPDYLTPEYFDMYKHAVEYAAKKGMQVWMYDEGGWPSGSATGKIVRKRPELLNRSVKKQEVDSPYVPCETALAAFCDGKRVEAGFTTDKKIDEYYIDFWEDEFTPPYPCIIDPETTDEFIKMTHDKYKEYLGEYVGTTLQVAFTDEPSALGRPWCRGFGEMFKERYGYDLTDYLPAIMDEELDTEEGAQAKIHYHDLVAELLNKNYLEKLRAWCNENNMLSGGHFGGENETINNVKHGYHHIMRGMRGLDIPGIDTIWRQIFPGQKNHFFPRFASSAAEQIGSPYALSESFSIYGAGFTYEQMRYVMLYQMVRGINFINIMGHAYETKGAGMGGGRPNFRPEVPTWGQLQDYNMYSARMSYIMCLGRSASDTGLYMPMHDIWADGHKKPAVFNDFDETAYALERMHNQFDIIDDDFLETAELVDGKLVSGTAAYDTVVLPKCKRIPAESKAVLDAFVKAGGKVVNYDELEKANRIANISCDKVAVRKKILDNGVIYLINNESVDTETFSVSFADKGNIYEIDAEFGKIYKASGMDKLTLVSGEGRVYFITDEELDADYRKSEGEILAQPTDFSMARVESFTLGEEEYQLELINEEYKKTELGDWRKTYGDGYSGIVSYKTSFKLDRIPEKAIIDLGKVDYSCDKLIINGHDLGTRPMAPFVYEVDGKLLKEENELIVNIANTCANQFVTSKVLDKYPYEVIGPYHRIMQQFEGDFVESGLVGPVVVKELK